jgi:hypothetical protein
MTCGAFNVSKNLVVCIFAIAVFNLGGFVFGARNIAHAECLNYFDPPPRQCAAPCLDTYPATICVGGGCIQGICNSQGNSASCCGFEEHFYASITPDPNGPPCVEFGCGALRVRLLAKGKIKQDSSGLNSNLQPSYWSEYPLPRILFEPNKCEHEYRAFFEEDFTVSRKAGI